jgi:hypothetical protein
MTSNMSEVNAMRRRGSSAGGHGLPSRGTARARRGESATSHLSRLARACACASKQPPPLTLRPPETPPRSPSPPGSARSSVPILIMEPPSKRLRILRSVEVDETNPDYINAKQQQQQKFKSRLESIFAKYENMHESMSDEIDMRENKVVVDRGHLRRLARKVNRNETVLLDNLGMGNHPEPEEEEGEGEAEGGSEDELAPTQQPAKSRVGQTGTKRGHDTAAAKGAHSSPSHLHQAVPQITESMISPVPTTTLQAIPNTPNPAANLLSLVQFPQTPAGQQAQTSFYATLAQTINQAVQQAVAPLFSNVFANTPNVQLPFANPLILPTTPITNSDKIAPATDPKWFFPPLPVEPHKSDVARSSPIPPPGHSSPVRRVMAQEATIQNEPEETEVEEDGSVGQTTISVTALLQSEERADTTPAKPLRRTSPRVEIQRKRMSRTSIYPFTEEDDIYIANQKMSHTRTWADIKDSREEWKGWPLFVFQNRWSKRLRKNLHLQGQSTESHSGNLATTSAPHHLPTPSSLGNSDSQERSDPEVRDQVETVKSSSVHFDEDERDLLSLAGADMDEEELPIGLGGDEAFFPDTDETVLPSIELTDYVDESDLQQDLLDGSPTEEASLTVTKSIPHVKVEPGFSSPTNMRKRKQTTISYQAVSNSDTEVDGDEAVIPETPSQEQQAFTCHICSATFRNIGNLQRHQKNPRSTHSKPRLLSASLDLVGEDELQAPDPAPTTPRIKREFSTPPPTSFLFSTPAAQTLRAEVSSSGMKSAPGLSRRAYLKQIKQSWTKKSTPAPKTVTKRRSFHVVPAKRAWAGDADSEDELGI